MNVSGDGMGDLLAAAKKVVAPGLILADWMVQEIGQRQAELTQQQQRGKTGAPTHWRSAGEGIG